VDELLEPVVLAVAAEALNADVPVAFADDDFAATPLIVAAVASASFASAGASAAVAPSFAVAPALGRRRADSSRSLPRVVALPALKRIRLPGAPPRWGDTP
jgi:hypothetical protein